MPSPAGRACRGGSASTPPTRCASAAGAWKPRCCCSCGLRRSLPRPWCRTPTAARSIRSRCSRNPRSSSPTVCARSPRSAASGRAVKALLAIASMMPTCRIIPPPSTCTPAPARLRAIRTFISPNMRRRAPSTPTRRAVASMISSLWLRWSWAFVPTTCSRRFAAMTRAAGSTVARESATTSRMSTRRGACLRWILPAIWTRACSSTIATRAPWCAR